MDLVCLDEKVMMLMMGLCSAEWGWEIFGWGDGVWEIEIGGENVGIAQYVTIVVL